MEKSRPGTLRARADDPPRYDIRRLPAARSRPRAGRRRHQPVARRPGGADVSAPCRRRRRATSSASAPARWCWARPACCAANGPATHWMSRDLLRAFGAEPVAERVVVDGNLFTGGGVTAGIDVALAVAAEIAGRAAAEAIQLAIEYDPDAALCFGLARAGRPGGPRPGARPGPSPAARPRRTGGARGRGARLIARTLPSEWRGVACHGHGLCIASAAYGQGGGMKSITVDYTKRLAEEARRATTAGTRRSLRWSKPPSARKSRSRPATPSTARSRRRRRRQDLLHCDLNLVHPLTGPVYVAGAATGRSARGRDPRHEAGGLRLHRASAGLRLSARRLPRPVYRQMDDQGRLCRVGRPARCAHPRRLVCRGHRRRALEGIARKGAAPRSRARGARRRGVAARGQGCGAGGGADRVRGVAHDPAARKRRQHGHQAAEPRGAAATAGVCRRRLVFGRRRAFRAGRRRGLRHRDRNVAARSWSAFRCTKARPSAAASASRAFPATTIISRPNSPPPSVFWPRPACRSIPTAPTRARTRR